MPRRREKKESKETFLVKWWKRVEKDFISLVAKTRSYGEIETHEEVQIKVQF